MLASWWFMLSLLTLRLVISISYGRASLSPTLTHPSPEGQIYTMGIVDKVKDALHGDDNIEHKHQSGHSHTGQSFTQSGPGAQGTGSSAHGTLGSGPTSGGIGGDGTSQNNTGGPPGLQDYLGDNAAGQGGLAAQAAGGPGAPGQPGQIGGGVGCSGPTYPGQQGDIDGPQTGLGGQQGGFGGQQGGLGGQPGSARQGAQGF